MSEPETQGEGEALQFDRSVSASASSSPAETLAVACAGCQTSIETEYYDVNGKTCCGRCRIAVEAAAETPRGILPLVIAGVFGLGAGIVGAAIYYAVIAIAHLEIGIVAILIGYMVGYAVRKGARGRGGLRFQILAVALTYASIALAYAPIAVKQAIDANRKSKTAQSTASRKGTTPVSAHEDAAATATRPRGGLLGVIVVLLALIVALPVLVVVGSLPMGLISAFIIFVGMKQAWRMTGAPLVQILGPYRVGTAPASTSA